MGVSTTDKQDSQGQLYGTATVQPPTGPRAQKGPYLICCLKILNNFCTRSLAVLFCCNYKLSGWPCGQQSPFTQSTGQRYPLLSVLCSQMVSRMPTAMFKNPVFLLYKNFIVIECGTGLSFYFGKYSAIFQCH